MALYRIFFNFSIGLKKTIKVPIGTYEVLRNHVDEVTDMLGLKVEQYKENHPCWNRHSPPEGIDNGIACEVVADHNRFVRKFYRDLQKWSSNPPKDYEELTPELAKTIWYGLMTLSLTHDRWTRDAYIVEMEKLFDVMCGEETDGIEFDEEALTPKQAAAVIALFAPYLDRDDVRLELPNNHDYLVTSDEYYWCPVHGAWHENDVEVDDEGNVICPAKGCEEVMA